MASLIKKQDILSLLYSKVKNLCHDNEKTMKSILDSIIDQVKALPKERAKLKPNTTKQSFYELSQTEIPFFILFEFVHLEVSRRLKTLPKSTLVDHAIAVVEESLTKKVRPPSIYINSSKEEIRRPIKYMTDITLLYNINHEITDEHVKFFRDKYVFSLRNYKRKYYLLKKLLAEHEKKMEL